MGQRCCVQDEWNLRFRLSLTMEWLRLGSGGVGVGGLGLGGILSAVFSPQTVHCRRLQVVDRRCTQIKGGGTEIRSSKLRGRDKVQDSTTQPNGLVADKGKTIYKLVSGYLECGTRAVGASTGSAGFD